MTGTVKDRVQLHPASDGQPATEPGRGHGMVLRVELGSPGDQGIVRASVDAPRSGKRSDGSLVRFHGWVLGQERAVTAVEFRHDGIVLGQVAVDVERPDIRDLHPDLTWAGRSGFDGRVEAFKLPPSFELQMVAVFEDGVERLMGRIVGEWNPPRPPEGHLQPIMLTTLGRSGSTWVTRLLGRHPRVLSYAPFRCEPRAAAYWMEMYGGLSGPGSYQQILRGELNGPDWWAGTRKRRTDRRPEDPIEPWLAEQQVSTLLPQAIAQIEAFSLAAADLEGKGPGLGYFVEKLGLNTFVQPMLLGLYPRAREIMLVRDPRDMVCSMLSYNRKQGNDGFGRAQVESDADFVRWWRAGMLQFHREWQARSDRAFLLRYEDLIQDPLPTLSRLFDYIGVESGAALMDSIVREAELMRPDVQKKHQTSGNPAASIGRWRQDFTADMKAAAAEAYPDILESFGYAP